MREASAPSARGMNEFELGDDFWRDALTGLGSDAQADRLRERWPGFVELVDELAADAARESLLVGFRLATHGRNPRLFALLIGAYLARSGVPTLFLDLSPDTRWIELLLGGDFKEGLVDHLRFGVPLERCARATGFERLSAMSGGAWFLAGSPLNDAPGFRAALERLRQRHRAVVVTLPPPLEAGDGTGIAALCGALVTVEERRGEAPLVGSEHAIVRLVGDPEAARDLARLAHRFLGPLPSVLAGLARAGPVDSAGREAGAWSLGATDRAAVRETAVDPDLAFLRGFERTTGAGTYGEAMDVAPAFEAGESPGPASSRRSRSTRRKALFATLMAIAVLFAASISARGIVSDLIAWFFAEPVGEPSYEELGAEETIALHPAPSVTAALPSDTAAPEADSLGGIAPDSTAASPVDSTEVAAAPPAPERRRPVPYSVHVGSYQRAESGMRVVDRVEGMGYVATLAPVSLPGKGLWYRVYVGAFADSIVAGRLRDRLQSSEAIEEGVVRTTPWTFEIGVYPSREAAQRDMEALRAEGIAVYLVGGEPARLYAGAYQSREEAEILAQALETALDGRAARLTLREE